MIVEAANIKRVAIQVLADTRHVSEDVVSNRIAEKSLATLCAKDNVKQQLLVRRHAFPSDRVSPLRVTL